MHPADKILHVLYSTVRYVLSSVSAFCIFTRKFAKFTRKFAKRKFQICVKFDFGAMKRKFQICVLKFYPVANVHTYFMYVKLMYCQKNIFRCHIQTQTCFWLFAPSKELKRNNIIKRDAKTTTFRANLSYIRANQTRRNFHLKFSQ